ncbi:FecR protein [Thalassoglobus neptunius]|uniref:FecR protein n=1 Tax=Thalassoglobus neptunius TaxID=1938619 RepID=A0A5C5VVT6_9PLAN|nr:FecR domain-containing protein [Thalassoglobus neptunius]TWT42786.1 FecR protein [Thalassoglobus neptunius]
MEPQSLIHRYLIGTATEDDVQKLEILLLKHPELRREFVTAVATDTGLRDIALERAVNSATNARFPRTNRFRTWSMVGVVAATVLLFLVLRTAIQPIENVAMLVSSENASWESVLPTVPGSQLTPGILRLKSGIATLRFPTGAEMILEAPVHLELISAMRCRLLDGVALVEVPEAAIGFVVETPSGYAVDYGTRFAVRVDSTRGDSVFELIEGEIGVHHSATGEEIRLKEPHKEVTVSTESMHIRTEEDSAFVPSANTELVRIGTAGRSTSVLPNNKRHKFIDSEVLSVRKTENGKWDYRSFFEFDLTDVELKDVLSARLRLNLVPSRRGLVSRLSLINRFGVYGLTNPEKADWSVDATWEDSPSPEDGVLLGTFEIERSAQRGSFGIANDQLLEFLKNNSGKPVTLTLVRLTTQIEGKGPVLAHMFASDSHPEAVGPLLELTVKQSTER